MDDIQIAKETLEIEAFALKAAADMIDANFSKTVEMILSTKGKLIIAGVGKSGLVGAKMAATFASTGTPSFFLHPTEALHGDLGMMGKEDTVLAISYSGESEELAKILPHIKRLGVKLIGMTASKESTLGSFSDIVLPIKIHKEACPLGAAPTTSTTLTMALGDALAVALMHRRGFKQEDFASFHPGGSLGKRLFVKASDIMKKDDLPIIGEQTSLKDAIMVMNEGKIGTVLIINKENALTSLLSDGDLRRALGKDDFDLSLPALNYATKNPISLDDENLLATDVLKLIEAKKIQLLPITDKEKKIIGTIHIHDLINAGIKS
ncbi:Arabinose-5-phosphate isomerase [Sulfurovum sp. enrichment culture clone C5]|uniref:Arabinose-5-phosphate isomerase n=1 Tax=Sulfurovum sp. enrichment culture clone C5 TaxID=497650 RepID=A0A0S4XNH7_9BACT|nr:Arabinose-5-phosphate isomerase [Sulfurovum sp. enrichment culture clone C5]